MAMLSVTPLGKGVLLARRQAGARAEAVVGLEQLPRVADVVPAAGEAVAVDGPSRIQPRDEVPRLVGRVALVEIRVDESGVLPGEEVRSGGGERARRLLRLLDEADDPVVGVEVDHPVAADELAIPDVVDGEGAGGALAAPEPDVVRERILEQVVAGHDEKVVVQAGPVAHEADVADRSEPRLVRGGAVVVDEDAL